MTIDERAITYINSLENGDSPILQTVAREARDSFVPIIRKETAAFLKTLVEMKRPLRILEVGTAVGYSALLMAEHMPEGGHITTIEKYEKGIRKKLEQKYGKTFVYRYCHNIFCGEKYLVVFQNNG